MQGRADIEFYQTIKGGYGMEDSHLGSVGSEDPHLGTVKAPDVQPAPTMSVPMMGVGSVVVARLTKTLNGNQSIADACRVILDAVKDNPELDNAIGLAFGIIPRD